MILPAVRLAFRYVRTKKRGLVGLTSFIAAAGIAIGVAGLIVAQSVGRGFEDEMRERILSSTAHITVRRLDGSEIPEYAPLIERLPSLAGVTHVRPTGFIAATLVSEVGGSAENVVLRVDETDGTAPGTATLGDRLSEKFPKERNAFLTISAPGNGVALRLANADVFSTGIYEYDSTQVRISKVDFAKLQGVSEFIPSTLNVSVDDIFRSPEIAESIRVALGPDYKVLDWQEANRPLFSALELERRSALIVMSLLLLLAAVNITTMLSLLVAERRLDIAVFRTCGAKTSTIVKMFLFEGVFIASAGIVSGLVIGFFSCEAVNRFGILRLPAEVYSVSEIHLRPSITEAALIALGALSLSILASFIPAVRSTSVRPAENLRRS